MRSSREPRFGRENRSLRAAGAVRARRGRDFRRRPRQRAAHARARDRPRHDSLQVVPGRARALPGVPLAAAGPERVGRVRDRPRDRDEVPLVRRPASEQGRLAPASVPSGLRTRPDRARPVRGERRGARRATRGASARQGRARRGEEGLRHLAERGAARAALDGHRGRGHAAPAAGARLSHRELRRLRPQRGEARPGEASRPLARRACCRLYVALRDRRRRAGSRATRECRSAARARRARALHRACRRGGARSVVRALPCRLLRARRRGLRHGSLRGVPRREAGRDNDRRRRPARSGRGPAHGSRLRATRRGARGGLLVAAHTRRRSEDVGPRRQGDRAAGLVGRDDRSPAGGVRVAYYSPLPPERSGIADYSALLLPQLRRFLDVDVVRRGRTRPVAADVALYHVGNDPDAHGWIVDALRRRPGVVVLHDFVLHHLVAGLTIGRKDGPGYLAAMERDAGVAGRLLAHGVLDGRVPPPWETRPEEFPLTGEVLATATGLIVHSRYVEEQAREAGYHGPIWRIAHPAWRMPDVGPADVDGRPLFGCFGHINASKRIPQLLEAFAAVRHRHPNAKLLLVGSASPRFDASRLVGDGVERVDYVDEQRLWALMAACDACVSLRAPTMGETSGSAIRALSLGRPLVVSDLGWFAELPDAVALKVPVDDDEVASLAAALELLASSEPTQLAMSEAALEYVRAEHDLDEVAEEYVAALEEAAGGTAVADAVVDEVAQAAAEIGIDAGTPFTAELAERLDEVGLARNGRPVPAAPPRRSPLARVPPWAWLSALVVFSAVFRYGLSRRVVAPWIMVDELIYSELAKSFAAGRHFLVRDVHHGAYGAVYPALIAPAWRIFSSVPDAYAAAKTIGSVLMSLTAVPVYFLARRLLSPLWSLLAAALAVAVPSMMYTGTLMTETVFYPVFVCVALVLVLTLERPTRTRQLGLLALCVLAV